MYGTAGHGSEQSVNLLSLGRIFRKKDLLKVPFNKERCQIICSLIYERPDILRDLRGFHIHTIRVIDLFSKYLLNNYEVPASMLGNGKIRTNKGTFQSLTISEFNGKMWTMQNPPNNKTNKQKILRSSAIT